MAKSAAVKRLERILFDTAPEEYGPKLFRLKAKDRDYILGRIERGENAQVTRREILRLDKERIERRRATRATKAKPLTIEQLRAKAYTRLRQMLRGKPATQQKGVDNMNRKQLNFSVNAPVDAIRRKARAQNRQQDPTAYPDDLEIEYNVFWYK